MSEENGKVCCNCRHNLRIWDKDYCKCVCEIDGKRMSYIQVMTGWCRHWAKERKERKKMYESPIEINYGEMQTEYENGILKAVWKYDIHCNKEELLKALAYDRDQYRKGYEDAKPRWIPCSERLPKVDEEVFVYLFRNQPYIAWHDGVDWCTEDFTVDKDEEPIAWMPLPKAYGGGTE